MKKALLLGWLFVCAVTAHGQVWSLQGIYARIGLSSYRTMGSSVKLETACRLTKSVGLEAAIGQTSVASLTNDFKLALQNELFQSWDIRVGALVAVLPRSSRFYAEVAAGASVRIATQYHPIQLYFERVPDGSGTTQLAEGSYLVQYTVDEDVYTGIYAKASFGVNLTPHWSVQVPLSAETFLFQPSKAMQTYAAGLGIRYTLNPTRL